MFLYGLFTYCDMNSISFSLLIHSYLNTICSDAKIFTTWQTSIIHTKSAASTRLSTVPVSNQINPHPSILPQVSFYSDISYLKRWFQVPYIMISLPLLQDKIRQLDRGKYMYNKHNPTSLLLFLFYIDPFTIFTKLYDTKTFRTIYIIFKNSCTSIFRCFDTIL